MHHLYASAKLGAKGERSQHCQVSSPPFRLLLPEQCVGILSLEIGSSKPAWLFLQHISSKKCPKLQESRGKSGVPSDKTSSWDTETVLTHAGDQMLRLSSQEGPRGQGAATPQVLLKDRDSKHGFTCLHVPGTKA